MTVCGRRSAASLLIVASLAVGCSSPGSYWRSRGADLLDAVPVSVAHGWGIGVSAKVTPLFMVGLNVTPVASQRYGYDDRYVNGIWNEFQAGFPWAFFVGSWSEPQADHLWPFFLDISRLPQLPAGVPWTQRGLPIVYRWQMVRDAPSGEGQRDRPHEPNVQTHGRHPPLVRESMGGLLWPVSRRWLEFHDLRREQGDDALLATLGSPERATLWKTEREGVPAWRAWDLVEVDAFAGIVGVRVGLRPIEFVDFVLGLLFLDPLLDDFPAPESWEPRPFVSAADEQASAEGGGLGTPADESDGDDGLPRGTPD